MGTHNVKILTKKQTKLLRVYMCIDNGTESMYAYGGQCKRLQGIHLLSRICAALATARQVFTAFIAHLKKYYYLYRRNTAFG